METIRPHRPGRTHARRRHVERVKREIDHEPGTSHRQERGEYHAECRLGVVIVTLFAALLERAA